MVAAARKKSFLKKTLSTIFLAAAVGASVEGYLYHEHQVEARELAVQSLLQDTGPYTSRTAGQEQSSRGLTDGEIQLVHTLFGKAINASAIRLHFFGEDEKLSGAVPDGNKKNIEIYGHYASPDYSKDQDGGKFGTFVHLVTLVGQNQRGEADWPRSDVEGDRYPLSSQWNFDDYGPHQQAAIMEDYARRFLHPSRHTRYVEDKYGDREDTDPFLKALVEDKFPQAKQARLAHADVETRPLTEGEESLIRSIFGKAVDTSAVRNKFHPQAYDDIVASVASDKGADFWGKRQYSKDFSQDESNDRFGDFVHEMTHVWQRQTDWRYTPNQKRHQYNYPLDKKWDFTDYSVEQQAAIIEDYARIYLRGGKPDYLPNVYENDEMREKLPLLQKLVEDQFPAAGRTREAAAAKVRAWQP